VRDCVPCLLPFSLRVLCSGLRSSPVSLPIFVSPGDLGGSICGFLSGLLAGVAWITGF